MGWFKLLSRARPLLILAGALSLAGVARAQTVVSITQTTYDADDRPVCQTVRMNLATTATDACSYGTSGSDGPDRMTRTVYDPDGNVIELKRGKETADAANEGQIYATYGYSQNGIKVMEADADGNVTRYIPDAFDRLDRIIYADPASSHSLQPCSDPRVWAGPVGGAGGGCPPNNPQIYTQRAAPPSGATINPTPLLNTYNLSDYEQFTYDKNGNKLTWRRRNGKLHTYAYDNLNRQWSDTPTAGGALSVVYSSYDLLGRVCDKIFTTDTGLDASGDDCDGRYTAITTAGIHNTYDKAGRLLTAKDPNGRVMSYAYNEVSSRTSLTWPDSVAESYQYYANTGNVLSWVGVNGTSTGLTPSYDARGRMTTAARSNGAPTTLQYDGIGRVTEVKHDLSGTANDITWDFAYNPGAQLRSIQASSTVYDYGETSTSGESRNYDGLNRDTAIAAISGGYDANGNLANEGTGGRTFTYDMDNRLLTAVNGSTTITLTYDPMGRLSSYTKGTSSWTYLYDNTNLVAVYLNGAMDTRYLHTLGTDQPFVQFAGTSTASTNAKWFYANYQGSIIALADSSGVVASSDVYRYDPWGRPYVGTYSSDPNAPANQINFTGSRFRYTGQTVLPDASLYYYKARVYDPVYGRFLQTDPIGSKDDLDLYDYVGDDPINHTDPTGLECVREVKHGAICRVNDGSGHHYYYRTSSAKAAGPMLTSRPTNGPINKKDKPGEGDGNYGSCRGSGCSRTHQGTDYQGTTGDPVKAAGDGVVVRVTTTKGGYGTQVVIGHADNNGETYTQYGHLNSSDVKVGEVVTSGQVIGEMGRSGNTPAQGDTHVHFEVRVGSPAAQTQGGTTVDPESVLPPGS